MNRGLHLILGSSTSQRMNLISVQHDNIMAVEKADTNRMLDKDTITKKLGEKFSLGTDVSRSLCI